MANTYSARDANPEPRDAIAEPNLPRLMEEIRDGLKNERERINDAVKNLDFFEGCFEAYPVRPPNTVDDGRRTERTTLLMRRIVTILTANLYNAGPARKLPDHPAADKWLADIYRRHLIDARWQQADRYALVSDVAAWQVTGDTNPDCPVKIQLWDASSFTAWSSVDDPTRAVAVATIDRWDERMRVRLWTDEIMQTWLSDKVRGDQLNTAKNWRLVSEEEHPYGIVPFAFVHVDLPNSDFWAGGFGSHLSHVNDLVNLQLTRIQDSVDYNLNPLLLLQNTRPGWRPRSPIRPGDVTDLPADTSDEVSNQRHEPDAKYLQADSGFVAASWDDLQSYLDHTLEMVGVPPSAIRMEQRGAMSGVAIVAEQIPMILWAMSRQRPFSHYEDNLAKVVLTVGATHLGNNGVSSAELEAAAADPGLVLGWPDMFPDLPGPERDQSDQWLLDNGMRSRTQILMRRQRLTREEAEAALEETAEDLKREKELFAEVTPAPLPGNANPGDPYAENLDPNQEDPDAALDDDKTNEDDGTY